jgi:hypothetical protein
MLKKLKLSEILSMTSEHGSTTSRREKRRGKATKENHMFIKRHENA